MAKKYVSAYRGAGFNKNRVTKRKKVERISAYTKEDKNQGGLLGGIGYVGANLGLGAAGVLEGAGDLIAAGGDFLRGDTDMAQYRFLDNKTAQAKESLDEWYNPNGVMEFVGDAAHGVGQSSIFLLDAVAPGLGTGLFFAGVGSQGISSAAAQTGNVGWREIGYGVASGVAEAALEKFTGAGGKVAGKLGASLTRTAGKTIGKKSVTTALTKAVGKSAWGTVLKGTLKDAAGEFVEEAGSEVIDAGLLWAFGIDPNAFSDLSLWQVLRAGAVGAVSGATMSAPVTYHNFKNSAKAGKTIREAGEVDNLIHRATATVSVLQAQEQKSRQEGAKQAKTANGKEADGKEADGKPADGQTTVDEKPFRQRMGAKLRARKWKSFAEKLDKNIQGYLNLSEDIRNSEAGDALLGELRGNLYYTNMAYAVEEAEDAIYRASDEEMAGFVSYINAEAKRKKQQKSDYTVEDFRANKDGILSQLAARVRIDEIFNGRQTIAASTPATPTQTAAEAAQGAEGVKAEEVGGESKTADTEEFSGLWEALTPEEGIAGFGVQNKNEEALVNAAVNEGVPKRSIPAMLDAYRSGTSLSPQEFAEGWADGVLLFGKSRIDESHIAPESAIGRMEENSRRAAIRYGNELSEQQRQEEIAAAEKKKKPAKEAGVDTDSDGTRVKRSIEEGKTVVEISPDEELTKRINNSSKNKYDVIREYLIEKFYGQTFSMSDGRIAIMDKRDAKELSHKANENRTVQLGNLRKIVETATYDHSTNGADHPKFTDFHYYKTSVRYNGEIFDLWINVGVAKNDGQNHIYSITNREETPTNYGVSRPVGNAIQNASSTDSIPHPDPKVNRKNSISEEKVSVTHPGINIRDDLNPEQYVAYKAAEIMAPALGTNIELHKSLTDSDGRPANGYYDEDTNTLHININAMRNGKRIALYTLGHEVTHYIKAWSPAKFYELGDFVIEKLGIRAEQAIRDKLAFLENTGQTKGMTPSQAYDLAYEEVVCDGMEGVLADGNVLNELARTDKSLWQRIKKKITEIIRKIKKAYADLNQASQTAKVLAETVETLESVEQLFYEGVVDAGERTKTAGVETVTSTNEENVQVRRKYSVEYENAEPNQGIIEMVKKVKTGIFNDNDPVELGYISDKNAMMIQKLTGINVTGYKMVIEARQIRHILRDHGENGLANQSMADPNDIAKMEYALENPDTIVNAGKTKAYSYMKNGYNRTADTVRYEKNIGEDNYYVIQAVPEAKAKTLFVVGAYIGNQEHNQKASQPASAHGANRAPNATSENAATNAFGNNIPQNSESVNRKYSISEENSSDTSDIRYSIEETPPESPDVSENGTEPTKAMTQDADAEALTGEILPKPVLPFRRKLVEMLGTMVESDADYRILSDFSKNIDRQDARQERINELNMKRDMLRDIQYNSPDPAERSDAAKQLQVLYKERAKLEAEMAKGDSEIARLREMAPVKNLMRQSEKRGIEKADKKIKEVRAKRDATLKAEKKMAAAIKESEAARRKVLKKQRSARRIIGRLHTLTFHPTKERHTPPAMQKLLEDVLTRTNIGDFGQIKTHMAKLAKLEREIQRLEDNPARTEAQEIALDKRIKEHAGLIEEQMIAKKQAEELLKIYKEFGESEDPEIQAAYDETAAKKMEDALKDMEQTPIFMMTLKSIEAVDDFYRVLYHQIRTANRLFLEQRNYKATAYAEQTAQEIRDQKPLKILSPTGKEWMSMDAIREYFWKNMKPLTAFEVIGSERLAKLFQHVLDGEDIWAADIMEAKDFLDKTREKYGHQTWDFNKRYEVKTSNGKTAQLNLPEMMALYAYSFREQAYQHLEKGGFRLALSASVVEKFKNTPLALRERLNDQERYTMDEIAIGEMASQMTTEQKEYVKEVQKYLTGLGKKGNEISRVLYGIDIFKEEFYFPIQSQEDYINSNTGPTGDPNIKNRGMTRETTPNANNPLVLKGFDDVSVDHINSMATYHAFVLPIEDLMKVMNYQPANIMRNEKGEPILDEDGNPKPIGDPNKAFRSVKEALSIKYGNKAVKYIEQLVRDLNGGARRDMAASMLDKGLTAFKRATTTLSLSTILQQPTSIIRAMAYVKPAFFTGAERVPWKTVTKYAKVAFIKEMGGHDINTGARTSEFMNAKEYKSLPAKAKALLAPEVYGGDAQYRAEVFGWLTSKADEVAWRYLFGACVNEQAAKLKKPKDSEEVLQAAGKRFTEVVRRTQVYDSTSTRSELMRSKDTGAKLVTQFAAEPTTVANMVIEAIVKAERGDGKAARAIAGGVAGSIILNSIAASLIYAMRDDDEEKNFAEKYAGSLTAELIEGFNPLEYLPYARDLMSIFKGYEVERSDMTLYANLRDQVELITSSKRSVPDKIFGVSGAVSAFFGVPVTNLYRDAKGMLNTTLSFFESEPFTGTGLGYAVGESIGDQYGLITKLIGKESGDAYQLYRAYVKGDTAHYNRVAARYEDEKAVEQALRKELRENDKRINTAARARIEGDLELYESTLKQIEDEGIFDRDIAIRAINNEINELRREIEKGQTVPKDDTYDEDEEEAEDSVSLYRTSDLNDALERGDSEDFEMIYYVLLTDKKEAGKTEAQAKASVKSSITAHWKKQYIAAWEANDTAEIKRIQAILLSTGLYGSRNDVAETGQGWVKNYAKSKATS